MTIPEGATEVILSYVRRKAAEWTPEQMAQRVEAAVAELEAAARAVPDDLLEVRQEGQEWSPLECIRPRRRGEPRHGHARPRRRLRGCRARRDPRRPPDPRGCPRDPRRGHRRRHQCRARRQRRPDAEIVWLHPFLGDLNWREWLLTLRVHSLDHARQLQVLQGPA